MNAAIPSGPESPDALAETSVSELVTALERILREGTIADGDLLFAVEIARQRAGTLVEGAARVPAAQAIVETSPAQQSTRVSGDAVVRRAAVQETERREPLRRRVLAALGLERLGPSALANVLPAPPPSVSRMLRALADEGLVAAEADPRDGRRRVYFLTVLGQAELTEHTAFGAAPGLPAPPHHDEILIHLSSALEAAVDLRRRTHRLQEVEERLRLIIDQARRAGAPALALAAQAELATTLRQGGRDEELRPQLQVLEGIASGVEDAPPELMLPALGHLEYELGLLREPGEGADPSESIKHLVTAHQLFQRLGSERDSNALRLKSARAEISLAEVWREQTQLGHAIDCARRALAEFELLDDAYGTARSHFVLGVSLLLRGQFDEALTSLTAAHELATQHAYGHLVADSLTQMGEVRRCQASYAAAEELLSEARAQANRLGMAVTLGFAESALGATLWTLGEPRRAIEHLEAAHVLFSRHEHRKGVALNRRRHAVVQSRSIDVGQRLAAQHLRLALTEYRQMSSPAGAAACLIDLGLLSLRRKGAVSHVQQLLACLADGTWSRQLIELDPWVPSMLADLAKQADDEQLRDVATAVARNAEQRRVEREDETSAATDLAGHGTSSPVKSRRARLKRSPDPMAGEPRCRAPRTLVGA